MASHHRKFRTAVGALACALVQPQTAGADLEIASRDARVRVVTVASELEHPWGLAFLPDRSLLVTERPGRLRLVANGKVGPPLSGVPPVLAQGQGGLLDVALAPDFERSRQIFFSYAEPRDGGAATAVASAQLGATGLTNVRVIFRQQPVGPAAAGHYGSRLVFGRDGALFVTLGERQARDFTIRAQGLDTHFGKIVRIDRDGSAPKDNPFIHVPGALPEIWSYGHRNVQGAALHPQTGELWAVEHGPKGGDELNMIRAGANYGWPLVTHGVAYSGERIGIGVERAGIEPPVTYWVPSIATSGLAFYEGDAFPHWRGNALVTGLYGMLVRLELRGTQVVREERLLGELKQRIRDVRVGPDDLVYLLTDSAQGQILRLEPAT